MFRSMKYKLVESTYIYVKERYIISSTYFMAPSGRAGHETFCRLYMVFLESSMKMVGIFFFFSRACGCTLY